MHAWDCPCPSSRMLFGRGDGRPAFERSDLGKLSQFGRRTQEKLFGGEEDRGGGSIETPKSFVNWDAGEIAGFFFCVCGGHGVIAKGSEACGPGWRPGVSCWSSHHCGPCPPASFASVAGVVFAGVHEPKPVCCVWFSPAFFSRRLILMGSDRSIQARDREYHARGPPCCSCLLLAPVCAFLAGTVGIC
ncbi:unnamed protein product [Ectocarpus sp. 8 AP-2014]